MRTRVLFAAGLSLVLQVAAAEPIDRVLLIAGNTEPINLFRKHYRYKVDRAEFLSKVDRKRYIVKSWKSNGLIFIDRQIDVLRNLREKSGLTKALLDSTGPDLIVRYRRGNSTTGDFIADRIDDMFPQNSWPKDFDRNTAAFGLHITVNATLTNTDQSAQKTVNLEMPGDQMTARNKMLGSFPSAPIPKANTQDAAKPASEPASNDLEGTIVVCLGVADNTIEDGFREVADTIAAIRAEVLESNRQTLAKLLEKIGFDQLPLGINRIAGLDPKMRNDLHKRFEDNWKSLGFESAAESNRFFEGAPTVRFSVNVGLYRQFQAPDPDRRIPGVGMVYNFILIRP